MKRYLRRSNNIPMAVLGWKSPNQKQTELENVRAWPRAALWASFGRSSASLRLSLSQPTGQSNSIWTHLFFQNLWSHIIDKTTNLQKMFYEGSSVGRGAVIDSSKILMYNKPCREKFRQGEVSFWTWKRVLLFRVLWLHLSSNERWTAVASLPKGGDGYEEVHRIRFAFPSTFDSIYDKSKLTAHTSKCSG